MGKKFESGKFCFFRILYNSLLYGFFAVCSPFFLYKLLTAEKYKEGFIQRLGFLSQDGKAVLKKGNVIWVHAVSVGEAQASFSLIEELKQIYPSKNFIVSTTTATGQKVARTRFKNDKRVCVIYFPLDFFHSFHFIFKKYKIDLIIIMETEIWPNFLMESFRHNIPVILVNGRISQKSYSGYMKLRGLFLESAKSVRFFCMQEQKDADKLIKLGIGNDRIKITGNIKYDTSLKTGINRKICDSLTGKLKWNESTPVFIAGSTHNGEEDILLEVFNQVKQKVCGLKLIIAPRHPERIAEVEKLIISNHLSYIRKTAVDKALEIDGVFDVVLLDTMGELRHLYSIATVAFVGKSLIAPGGGQNILEPASLGIPVVFGRYMSNFEQVAQTIVQAQAGVMVTDKNELLQTVLNLFLYKPVRDQIKGNALIAVRSFQGATEKTIACVKEIINP